jgi:hypothetical protein
MELSKNPVRPGAKSEPHRITASFANESKRSNPLYQTFPAKLSAMPAAMGTRNGWR